MTPLATYGLIFIVTALVKSGDSVGNLLGFSSSLLGFASNAFFQLPDVSLIPGLLKFSSGSPDFLVWDILPWTHAVNAMRAVLLFDQSLVDVSGDLLLLLLTSLIWFIAGVYLFSKRKFRVEDI